MHARARCSAALKPRGGRAVRIVKEGTEQQRTVLSGPVPPQERQDIIDAVIAAPKHSGTDEPNWSAIGRSFRRDRVTCQRVWENAEEGRGLHPKPTGGQQSSPPTLQPMHLAYIQARASFGDALGSVSWLPVTLFCVFSSRSTTTRSPLALGQALYEMFPDLQLREVCEALVQDMGLEKVSGSQVHRAVTNVLELTLKRKTEVVCSVCYW
jgi:hypothetical protein